MFKKLTFHYLIPIVLMMGTAHATDQRVEAGFSALQYNEISHQYLACPTYAIIKEKPYYGDDSEYIEFSAERYDGSIVTYTVSKLATDVNIEVINKFLKWAELARERGDMLDKEIADDIWGVKLGLGANIKHRFSIYSGNAIHHYLAIKYTHATEPEDFLLDEENAKLLIKRLTEFKNGEIKTVDDSVYK